MAAVAAAQRTWLANHVDSDLLFLWNEAQVSLDLQHRLGQSGLLTVREFSDFKDSHATVRAAFADDFTLDVAAIAPTGPAARWDLAALACAWEDMASTQGHLSSAAALFDRTLPTTSWANDIDRMSFRAASVMAHHSVPLPAAGQRVVCRNKDRVSSFLCLEDSARMLLGCATTAQTFKDASKPWYHFKNFRDFDTDSEFGQRIPDDERHPEWWEGAGMRIAFGRNRDFVPAEDAEDDASWS